MRDATAYRYTRQVTTDAPAIPPIPHLDTGARMTRFEFERRYEASPPWLKAELIEGVVYVASPVSLPHCDEHFRLVGWLNAYTAQHPDIVGSDNSTRGPQRTSELTPLSSE